MITARLGGNKSPKAPDAVMSACERSFAYPEPVSTIVNKEPSAKTVTPDTPVKVVKKVVTTTAAIIKPPRNQPNSVLKTSTKRRPALPFDKI